ncbi:MAG TPA: chemotaxis-specific protein-glutamate methyltransferase CheB [Solirubrobacteraceae bacterium]
MTRDTRARRVLICEDSRAYAAALSRYLESDREIEVVGVAASGEQAISDVGRLRPDLLTLDMQLPGIDGLAVVRALMAANPLPIVILSAHVAKGSERAAEALAAGALDVVSKDSLRLDQLDDVWARAMRSRLRRLASIRVSRPPSVRSARKAAAGPAHVARAVGVGASTGGPPALEAVLGALRADFSVPVVVVQHMAPGFIDGLARWLDQKLQIAVRVAREGEAAGPGVWFAPDEAHLVLTRSMRFALDRKTNAAHRPSVDSLLLSLAQSLGDKAVGVVLTGMGKDGAEGAAAIRRAGGLVIVQDQASSVVYGMPRAAAQGGADLTLSPAEIGYALDAMRPPRAIA